MGRANRKGLSALEMAGSTLLIIAVLVVILIIAKSAMGGTKKSFTERECQLSLLSQSFTETRVPLICAKATTDVLPIKCNRNAVLVTDKEVIRNAKDATKEYDPRCPSGEASCLSHNVMAREMQQCWNQFFKGEKVVFQQVEANAFGQLFSVGSHKTACFVCSEVTLQTSADINGFTKYLQEKPMPGSEKTYYSFLNNSKAYCEQRLAGGPGCFANFGSGETNPRDPPSAGERIVGAIVPGASAATAVKDLKGLKDYLFSTQIEKNWYPRQGAVHEGQTRSGAYAVTFIRQGFDDCGKPGSKTASDAPTMTVQVLPADKIRDYCDVVLV